VLYLGEINDSQRLAWERTIALSSGVPLGSMKGGIPVYRREYLVGAAMNGDRIQSFRLERGLTVRAKMFIDASHEGVLLALRIAHKKRRDSLSFLI
jgi:hypothetical protein